MTRTPTGSFRVFVYDAYLAILNEGGQPLSN
jgi:hypothetical protein